MPICVDTELDGAADKPPATVETLFYRCFAMKDEADSVGFLR